MAAQLQWIVRDVAGEPAHTRCLDAPPPLSAGERTENAGEDDDGD